MVLNWVLGVACGSSLPKVSLHKMPAHTPGTRPCYVHRSGRETAFVYNKALIYI